MMNLVRFGALQLTTNSITLLKAVADAISLGVQDGVDMTVPLLGVPVPPPAAAAQRNLLLVATEHVGPFAANCTDNTTVVHINGQDMEQLRDTIDGIRMHVGHKYDNIGIVVRAIDIGATTTNVLGHDVYVVDLIDNNPQTSPSITETVQHIAGILKRQMGTEDKEIHVFSHALDIGCMPKIIGHIDQCTDDCLTLAFEDPFNGDSDEKFSMYVTGMPGSSTVLQTEYTLKDSVGGDNIAFELGDIITEKVPTAEAFDDAKLDLDTTDGVYTITVACKEVDSAMVYTATKIEKKKA